MCRSSKLEFLTAQKVLADGSALLLFLFVCLWGCVSFRFLLCFLILPLFRTLTVAPNFAPACTCATLFIYMYIYVCFWVSNLALASSLSTEMKLSSSIYEPLEFYQHEIMGMQIQTAWIAIIYFCLTRYSRHIQIEAIVKSTDDSEHLLSWHRLFHKIIGIYY